jgi:choline dehydrogenase-like flavoprotein
MVLEQLPNHDHIWDFCIVGSGPVGMSIALELERLGRDVLVLESGGREVDPKRTEDSRATIVDPRHHAPMEETVCRALGGASWLWGGRCVPYNVVDFMKRDFVPGSDWPIRYEDIEPWYRAACEYMLCRDDSFQMPFSRKIGGGLILDGVERWSTEPHVMRVHRERLEKSEGIKVCLNSTVIDLDLGQDGRLVEHAVVATPNGKVKVRARRMILATGGVEATRLLLTVQRRWPDHFAGTGGPLGRYYMGHLDGVVSSLVFDDPRSGADFDWVLDGNGVYYRRRFMLAPKVQLENKVLNSAFWLDNAQFFDPRHGSGILSAFFLALTVPAIGRWIRSEEVRLEAVGPKPYPVGSHLINIARDAPATAKDVYLAVRNRLFKRPRKPGVIFLNRGGRFTLHYHAEQLPNPESRIVLTDEVDRHGLPRVSIDFRFSDQDTRSVVESHRLLDTALQANKIGHLEYWYPPEQLQERVMELATDGHHQVGVTRMGDDPRDSVVDPNLKVHGVDNLYVVSSSVFRTDSQANSTLLAVALGMRLASHLNSTVGGLDQVAISSQILRAQPGTRSFRFQRVSRDISHCGRLSPPGK